ncbi:MAG TPA: ribosomal L7Ae/L30e/S12e/Gadd45 family protein [Candidatus Nanoarchaeia archaeon]|nr:ribosomal L7Ae/L30e/S12e/Gadd45 family protein [Candidatus Nanoarchaeia archaeon]
MIKKETIDQTKYLKEKLQNEKVIIGKERVLKALNGKSLERVFLAVNCPDKIKLDIQKYAEIVSIPVVILGQSNEEFGVFCKKNFFVSVLGTLKD